MYGYTLLDTGAINMVKWREYERIRIFKARMANYESKLCWAVGTGREWIKEIRKGLMDCKNRAKLRTER